MSDTPPSRPDEQAAVTASLSPSAPDGAPVTLTVRYFAAARAAVGVDEESVTIPAPATVAAVVESIGARHGEALVRVLTRCSYLRNAVAVRDPATPVQSGDQLDVLPPFAGG